jgi:hypothetical protein
MNNKFKSVEQLNEYFVHADRMTVNDVDIDDINLNEGDAVFEIKYDGDSEIIIPFSVLLDADILGNRIKGSFENEHGDTEYFEIAFYIESPLEIEIDID